MTNDPPSIPIRNAKAGNAVCPPWHSLLGVVMNFKQLEWVEQNNTYSHYTSFDFGWMDIYYTVDLVNTPLDTWEVSAGVHCSEFGADKIHLCAGLDNAKAAAQADFERLISSAMEPQQ